jgi:hypothetical protein
LPELSPLTALDIDLKYIYEVLPYTLCFMPKVKSVIITDERNISNTKIFKIDRVSENDSKNEIHFSINTADDSFTQKFAYFSEGDTSTVLRIEGNTIIPFPKEISRIFCGLPLVGTEEIGLPFLLNSLKFMPTTEREGIELEPTNEINRKLFSSSVALYGKMLDYIASNKLQNAFFVTHLCKKYNGTQSSNQQFYSLYIPGYKQHIHAPTTS